MFLDNLSHSHAVMSKYICCTISLHLLKEPTEKD